VEYTGRIEKRRAETDEFMKYAVDSPFEPAGRLTFDGLAYFPVDPAYRVVARIVPIENPEVLKTAMSDGSQEEYLQFAFAEFHFNGSVHRLLLVKSLEEMNTNRLFLAFTDRTSGEATYGGGRYIDLFQQEEEEITIDFNLAYNPYCVYNFIYACPVPPAENRLSIAVEAGEKMYPLSALSS
jgi:uncharacterized protein (DUF1684 family)